MTDYLALFQSKSTTWRKADPHLIRKWEWDARFHGDKNIKVQATSAKRAATTMDKMREQFTNLKPEHELALNAAASALRSMAEDLKLLGSWAKDYHAFCSAEWKKEENARLEALAQGRWGDDEVALKFECDLIEELNTRDGQIVFAGWCHSAGKYLHCTIDNIRCRVDRLLPGPSPRIRAALTVEKGNDGLGVHLWEGPSGSTVSCSRSDYEAYLAYRKEVAKASARIVAVAGRQS
jgi:hypothetical protein